MRSYSAAVAWIRSQVTSPTQSWHNLCQSLARQAAGADGWAPSALDAWNSIPSAHRHTSWPPPCGSIAYWGDREPGHATFVGDINGQPVFFSNDFKRDTKVDYTPVTDSLSHPFWGLRYLGWIDWTPSGALDIQKASTPSVKPTPKPTPSSSHVVSLANVAPGKANDDIKLMQSALAAEGENPGPIDGIYGPHTTAAVRAWQLHLGFTGSDADGVIGRVSLTALGMPHGFRVSA